MFIKILFFIVLGSIVGMLLSIIPGMHPNFIVFLIFYNINNLFWFFGNIYLLLSFIVSLTTSLYISSIISTMIYKIPGRDLELITQFIQNSRDIREIVLYYLKIIVYTTPFSIILLLIFIFFIDKLYYTIVRFLKHILLLFLLFLIVKQRSIKHILLIIFAAALGILVLNLPYVDINMKLFALFSGMFGLSFLVLNDYKEDNNLALQNKKVKIINILFGNLGSFLASLLPSISPSQIVSMFSLFKGFKSQDWIEIATTLLIADIFFSQLMIYKVGNPRAGYLVFIKNILEKITYYDFIYMIVITIVTICIMALLLPRYSIFIFRILSKFNINKLKYFVIFIVVSIAYALGGFRTIFILIASTALGILAIRWRLPLYYLMVSLSFPLLVDLFIG